MFKRYEQKYALASFLAHEVHLQQYGPSIGQYLTMQWCMCTKLSVAQSANYRTEFYRRFFLLVRTT